MEKNLIDNLNPQSAFKAGLLSSLALAFVLGFFILLGFLVNDEKDSVTNTKDSNNDTPKVIAPSPTTGAKDINIKGLSDEDWVKGERNAAISIIEFSDTECPFCLRFHSTMNQVVTAYPGEVNWVYRHFPLTALHSKAVREAEATECAGEQGGNDTFWAYLDRLFEITPANNRLEDSQLTDIAEYVNLNINQFQECLNSGQYNDKVKYHMAQGEAAGVRGTPFSVIIKGEQKIPIPGALPFEQVKTLLDPLL